MSLKLGWLFGSAVSYLVTISKLYTMLNPFRLPETLLLTYDLILFILEVPRR